MWFTLAAVASLVVLLVASFGAQLLYASASVRYAYAADAAPSATSATSATSERWRSRRVHWRSPRRPGP